MRDTLVYLTPYFATILFIAFVIKLIYNNIKYIKPYLPKKINIEKRKTITINPEKAKTFGNLIIYKYSPLTLSFLMLVVAFLFAGISPISFNIKYKIGGLGYAYFTFSLCILFAVGSLLFAKYYFNEFKKYKTS